jgi:hypothetical protein
VSYVSAVHLSNLVLCFYCKNSGIRGAIGGIGEPNWEERGGDGMRE